MARYFIEVSYKGTRYSGFQIQQNSNTIQAEVEKAINLIHGLPSFTKGDEVNTSAKEINKISLTGSSRTDAGVHAFQNFFHFDYNDQIHPQVVYKLNAIVPDDIVIKQVVKMHPEAHSRFDAISRKYRYRIHQVKNPFLKDVSFYFPYTIDMALLQEAALIIKDNTNFYAFCKTNSDVTNYSCSIYKSEWIRSENGFEYIIEANRFLRGMIRLLTAAIIRIGRGKLQVSEFKDFFQVDRKCGYSVPSNGLFLEEVKFPDNYFVGESTFSPVLD